MANNLPIHKKVQILNMLCEGSSMRSISRVVDCSINTVTKLLVETGEKCKLFQYNTIRNLKCQRIEVDEIWSFCYGKSKKLPKDKSTLAGFGDIWTWTAVCPDSKLVVSWHVGNREINCASRFMRDLSTRLANRVQITSDGHHSYLQAVEAAFGGDVHFGMLVKNYANNELNIEKRSLIGNPDMSRLSTSAVERQNLSMRMGMRRYTRKTNGHSKKIDNHRHALALYFAFHNFIRINSTLRVTPAMQADIATGPMSWEDFI